METGKHGQTIENGFTINPDPSMKRLLGEDWQDWKNIESNQEPYCRVFYSDAKMKVFTYCEGDLTEETYPDSESYLRGREETKDFYKALA